MGDMWDIGIGSGNFGHIGMIPIFYCNICIIYLYIGIGEQSKLLDEIAEELTLAENIDSR